ncbi:host specificity protein J, partial [Escherichia coli]
MGKGSSKGHTPREAKDNLKSTQLLSVIDAISEGPVEGPVDGLKSVLLNSTPVLDSEGNTNISGVTVVFRAGEQEQTPPEGFESSGSETVLGTEVKYDTPINGAHFDGDQSGTVNGVTPPAVQHLTAEVTADSGEYQVLARWDTPKVVKGVSFLLRLTVTADDGSERLVSTARTTETTYRFRQLALGRYMLTVRAVNAWGQLGDPASVSFRIAAPAAPSRIELTPGYFQITATPHLAVYDPTVQFEFWFSEKRITDIRKVETTARYLGT